MIVKCTCDLDVSYRDNVVQQIVIHAMRDTDIRGRVISRNTNGELKTIAIAKLIGDSDQWLHFPYALPHHVQDTITGWLSMRPRDTPMIQIGTPTKKARQTHNWCPDYNKEGGCSNTKTESGCRDDSDRVLKHGCSVRKYNGRMCNSAEHSRQNYTG